MTPDNSNISSLFGDLSPTPPSSPVPVVPEVSTTEVSGTVSEGIFSAIQQTPQEEVKSPPVAPAIPVAQNIAEVKPPEIPTSSAPQTLEIPVDQKMPPVEKKVTETVQETESDEDKLKRYMEEDFIYQSMIRVVDADKIRLRLAIRYTIVMFAIFLVVAWVVNNRIIMFGFSEFHSLARIRDGLFGLLAGLFSMTLWFGSEVWFPKTLLILLCRFLAVAFFVAVLSALYFPLW